MDKERYIYWKDEHMWIGYLEKYPDYMTQGETIEELKVSKKSFQLFKTKEEMKRYELKT